MNISDRAKTLVERADVREVFDAMYEPVMLVAAGMLAGMIMVDVVKSKAKANALDALVFDELEQQKTETLRLRAELDQERARVGYHIEGAELSLPRPEPTTGTQLPARDRQCVCDPARGLVCAAHDPNSRIQSSDS